MRFVVTKPGGSGIGKARLGVLHFNGGSGDVAIETPALVMSTLKGLPAFISRDLLASLPYPDSLLLHVSPVHFTENPSMKTIANMGGLHHMLGLQEHIFIASASDSVQSLPESDGSNKLGASFDTPGGRRLVKPSNFIEMISSMKPNLWASLADEVPSWVSEKRNRISVDRTIRWLDECLALDVAGEKILGAIVGGSSIEERKRCVAEVSKRNVSGFWIGGLGLGDNREDRSNLLNVITDGLSEEKLRFVSRLGLPEEVLQGVAAGIDLFDSNYIYHITIGGFAIVFPLDILERDPRDSLQSDFCGEFTKINLRATIYGKDTSPIVEGCSCYTCTNHTRAYLNHLLNVHEMLAQILLEVHNAHHYLGFFRSLREAIKAGKFDLFRQRFLEARRAHLSASAPCL